MKKEFRVVNSMGGYCFSGTKRECDHYLKYAMNSEDSRYWEVKEHIPFVRKKVDAVRKRKKKYSGQDTADIIESKIKYFDIKDIHGKELKSLLWCGPYSGVYGCYEAVMNDGSKFLVTSDRSQFRGGTQGFKPNATDIDKYFPGYKNICRKRIKLQ